MKIVIAGASGYIGRELIDELLHRHPGVQIIALSRRAQSSHDPRLVWQPCDVFSLKSLEEAIPSDVDAAYYLVHSMGRTAKLDQGSFADYDLLLADNFVRRLRATSVRRIIYLGGLVSEHAHLSQHLQSRLEVEVTFQTSGIPTTVFRAGLIIGTRGSSFQILTKLVSRLPVMICPSWTQTLTTPVGLARVVEALIDPLQSNEQSDATNQTFDLAGCRALTYVQMMRETAHWMKKRRLFLTVPFFTPTLSRLWVRLITGAPKQLVYPLIESLEHPMVARSEHLLGTTHATYENLLETVGHEKPETTPLTGAKPPRRNTVRSVQRLPLPAGRDAEWVGREYTKWLPHFLRPVLKVTTDDDCIRFCLISSKLVLLELKYSQARSSPDRQLFYVVGGLLSAKRNKGRLEFREVLNRTFILTAIHDFEPALPWPLYRISQAVAHVWVMRNYARHLKHL